MRLRKTFLYHSPTALAWLTAFAPSLINLGSAHADEAASALPLARNEIPWLEDRSIQLAIRSTNHGNNQIVFAFDNISACNVYSKYKYIYTTMLFTPSGIKLDLSRADAEGLGFDVQVTALKKSYLVTLSTPACRMKMFIEKLVREGGIWSVKSPSVGVNTKDQSKDQRFIPDSRSDDPAHYLMFDYEIPHGKSCPSGGGPVVLYHNALVSEFGTKLKGKVGKGAGSDTETSYTVTNDDCRYIIKMSMSYRDRSNKEIPVYVRDFNALEYRPFDLQPWRKIQE